MTDKMRASDGRESRRVCAHGHGQRQEVKNQAQREQTAFQDCATAICLRSNTKKQHVALEAFSAAIPFMSPARYFCHVQRRVSANMYEQSECFPQHADVLDCYSVVHL